MKEPNFRIWDRFNDPSKFLVEGWHQPDREVVAKIIHGHVDSSALPLHVAEIGPGGAGHDYMKFHAERVRKGELSYTLIEGCKQFADNLRTLCVDANVVHGTFADIEENSCDITFTRHTLEHQPSLNEPLTAFIRGAKKLAIVVWFLAPSETESTQINYREDNRVYNNVYSVEQVEKVAANAGASVLEGTPKHISIFVPI